MKKALMFLWLGIGFIASTAIIESLLLWYTPTGLMVWAYDTPYVELPTMHTMWSTLLGFGLVVVSATWLTVKKGERYG